MFNIVRVLPGLSMLHAGNVRVAVREINETCDQMGKIPAMGLGTYFFDLPVYRLPEERYYYEMNSHIDRQLYGDSPEQKQQMESLFSRDPDREIMMRDLFRQSYGGGWRYNEIIGYIRLHFFGSQISGEYYGVSSKRICKTRRKILKCLTSDWVLPRTDVPPEATSEEIFTLVAQYVTDCGRKLKGRYIDRSLLNQLAPFVDWRRLFDEVQQARKNNCHLKPRSREPGG